jgi:hypothetical protein
MDFTWLYLLIGLGGVLVIVLLRLRANQPGFVCASCYSRVPRAQRQMRGSLALEIILWLCGILPGLIYSIARAWSSKRVCPVCGHADLLPEKSPRAKQLLAAQRKA